MGSRLRPSQTPVVIWARCSQPPWDLTQPRCLKPWVGMGATAGIRLPIGEGDIMTPWSHADSEYDLDSFPLQVTRQTHCAPTSHSVSTRSYHRPSLIPNFSLKTHESPSGKDGWVRVALVGVALPLLWLPSPSDLGWGFQDSCLPPLLLGSVVFAHRSCVGRARPKSRAAGGSKEWIPGLSHTISYSGLIFTGVWMR